MNNGIISFAPNSVIDNRTLGTLPLNNNILRTFEDTLGYPKGNNLYEGYYNSDNYVVVIDTRVNNSLAITLNLTLQQGGFLTIVWGDGSYGGIVGSINTQRNGSFETNFVVGGTSVWSIVHTYPKHDTYIVQFIGRGNGFASSVSVAFGNVAPNITHVLSFGTNKGLTTCLLNSNTNLIYVPENAPPDHLGNYSANGGMFRVCTRFNHPNISKWNLNNNTSLAAMFRECSSFNQPISNVIVNSGSSCSEMFFSCISLNNPYLDNWVFNGNNDCTSMFMNCSRFIGNGLDSWNTGGIVNMSSMFRSCFSFIGSGISNWNTSNVTNMSSMFSGATLFNQPLNNWNVRKVTNFTSMFQSASNFNSSLSGWALGADSSSVNCDSMFISSTAFNQDIGNWDVSKVTYMPGMFQSASNFNNGNSSSINSWNTSNVTNMFNMFWVATSFNQPIGGWNVGNVTSMINMFNQARNFNQNLDTWNVSKVRTMTSMFDGANAFQGNISTWNLAGLNVNTALDSFMANKSPAYSTTNYDALLIGWNNNKLAAANGIANWRTDLRPNFGGAKYTSGGAAATARAALVSYGWTITDGGVA